VNVFECVAVVLGLGAALYLLLALVNPERF